MVARPVHLSSSRLRPVALACQSQQHVFGIVGPSSQQNSVRGISCCALVGTGALASGSARHLRGARSHPHKQCLLQGSLQQLTTRSSRQGNEAQRPSVALFIIGSKTRPDNIPPIVEAVRARGDIVRAVIVVDDWRKSAFDSAKIRSLGVEILSPPPVKGGSRTLLNEAVRSASQAQVVAICPNSVAQEEGFDLAQKRGQSTWSVQQKPDHIQLGDLLNIRQIDEVIEYTRIDVGPGKGLRKAVVLQKCGKHSILKDWAELAVQPPQDRAVLKNLLDEGHRQPH